MNHVEPRDRARLVLLALLGAGCGSRSVSTPDVSLPDARDAATTEISAPDAPPADGGDTGADGSDAFDASDVATIDASDALASDALAADAPVDDVALDAIDAVVAADDAPDASDAATPADVPLFVDAACGARYASFAPDPGIHVDPDAGPIAWSTNPPSSGEHYPSWAVWGVHADVVPRGNYVHNLEHGGVVVQYRCDGDCASTRAQLVAFVTGLPPEATCTGSGVDRRIVLTEDPLIDAPVTASAWGWTYHADCVDPSSLAAFVFARTGHAPEDFCSQGQVP